MIVVQVNATGENATVQKSKHKPRTREIERERLKIVVDKGDLLPSSC